MKLVEKQGAVRWGEAFPVGNGHMGAMIYGSLPGNRIELSENTFFSGEKSDGDNRKGADQAFYEMRELAARGEYDRVHEKAEEFIGIRNNYGTNLPVGQVLVDYGIRPDEVEGYGRSLDIMEGVVTGAFCKDGCWYREEVFLSNPDHILVDHITLDKKGEVRISFSPANDYGEVYYEDSALRFTCMAYETLHCDQLCGVMAVGYASVVTDGSSSSERECIVVRDATDIKLYLDIRTDFKRTASGKCREEMPWEIIPQEIIAQRVESQEGILHDRMPCEVIARKAMSQDGMFQDVLPQEIASEKVILKDILLQEVMQHVEKCREKEYSGLLERHRRDIGEYMKRVDLRLEGAGEELNKLAFLFQYGRYLLLSSSREDSSLPAHLQGIWNDNVACRIGWTCDMHLDINTQMNYWPCEAANLSETAKPLFRWIAKDLAPSGAVTARESYGLGGWVGELVSNAWGFAAPYWASPIAPCPTGGVWVMLQMWEHYLYSRDVQFLEEEFLPLLEGTVEFFEQYLFVDEASGYYTGGPSISPENSFLYRGKPYQISNGCTYEILMIRELFNVYQESCEILGIDHDRYRRICEKTGRLLPYRLTPQGTIAEWNHGLEEADPQHRHTSHLLGLYPFSQINPEDAPLLCEAAEKTIQAKLDPVENWEDTGWARSMLMLYEARLYHGDQAYGHIKSMMENLLEPNHMVYHPPTRGAGAFDHVYELDGNTGLVTGITELLLQSQRGIIRLLPALPTEWEAGEVKGLRARGNITVDLKWSGGRLEFARLKAGNDGKCRVAYSGKQWELELVKGGLYLLDCKDGADMAL
ncbi:MAG TPA: glycoside hydrolase family 95 protein [Clostridiales bacterium]|nr:glycoside hydrolase family 95 protein [Clostridiales bacterium]